MCVNGRPLIGNWQRGKEGGKRESELQWTISNEREREREGKEREGNTGNWRTVFGANK